MTHLLILIVLVIFNKYVTFGFFSFFVLLGQLLSLSISAGGVLAVSYQIGVSIVFLILEALRCTKDKKNEIHMNTPNWYEYLAIGIIVLVWIYIVLNDFHRYRGMSLHDATLHINENREIGGLLLRAGTAMAFAYVTNYCVIKYFRKNNEL